MFRLAEHRRLRSLGLPLLATKHGSLEEERCAVLLRDVLQQKQWHYPERLWVIAPGEAWDPVATVLQS
jgi:hypothetical protein